VPLTPSSPQRILRRRGPALLDPFNYDVQFANIVEETAFRR